MHVGVYLQHQLSNSVPAYASPLHLRRPPLPLPPGCCRNSAASAGGTSGGRCSARGSAESHMGALAGGLALAPLDEHKLFRPAHKSPSTHFDGISSVQLVLALVRGMFMSSNVLNISHAEEP